MDAPPAAIWENERTLSAHLQVLPHHAIGATDDEWLEERYAGFPDDALLAASDIVKEFMTAEIGVYVDMRESNNDYLEWVGKPGAEIPAELRAEVRTAGSAPMRYRTRPTPAGDVAHRYFIFPPGEYPDIAARHREHSWLHMKLHRPDGCPICSR